jgi:hypothetical protein
VGLGYGCGRRVLRRRLTAAPNRLPNHECQQPARANDKNDGDHDLELGWSQLLL